MTKKNNNIITREMIKNGFNTGKISITENFSGCIGVCCKIGDNAFYFVGYLHDLNEYWKSYTLEETIDMIFNILKDKESAEKNGLDNMELYYYEAILSIS